MTELASPPATHQPIISLHDVGKTFANGTVALEGLDLDVRKGEFLTLLGPSGCGKSTALRLIAGLGEPTRGEITWTGDTTGAGAAHGIGFVFQEPTLMPWTTVAGNVALPLQLARTGRTEATSRVADAIERVGLASFRDAFPRQLSGGMKMRAAIARALVTNPRLLLMDEPFAALDEFTRFKLNDELLELWRKLGKTVVFVTHSVFESVYLSSRIAVFTPHPGRVFTDLRIDTHHPRDERFRTSAEYAGYCRLVSQALTNAIAAGTA